jgi:hypothetical protein
MIYSDISSNYIGIEVSAGILNVFRQELLKYMSNNSKQTYGSYIPVPLQDAVELRNTSLY